MAAYKATKEVGIKDLNTDIVRVKRSMVMRGTATRSGTGQGTKEDGGKQASHQASSSTLAEPTFTSSLRNAWRYKFAIIFLQLVVGGGAYT